MTKCNKCVEGNAYTHSYRCEDHPMGAGTTMGKRVPDNYACRIVDDKGVPVVFYTESYKYRIAVPTTLHLKDCPHIVHMLDGDKISMPFAYIEKCDGEYYLTMERYYGWDGATWAIDSKKFRLPSGAHDALLEMIGLGLLPADPWKPWTDKFLIHLCERKGMWKPRRWWVYKAVTKLGDPTGSKPRKVFTA